MIIPIVAYGDTVLRQKAKKVDPNHPGLHELIDHMFQTMYKSHGVGLAAPQVGESLRLFVADGSPMEGLVEEDKEPMKDWKRVFINPEIVDDDDDEWSFEEGCLSIPDIREDVWRPVNIRVKYYDENFVKKVEDLSWLRARIVQHEFDHLEGVLFVDYLSGLKRQLLRNRLSRISKGLVETKYPMRFPKKK